MGNCMWPYGLGGWGLGPLIFGALLIGAVVLVVVVLRKNNTPGAGGREDQMDSLRILKMRLARGEITEEEYNHLKKVLES